MNKTGPVALLAILLLSGCETIQIQTRADRMAMTQDQLIAQENQRRMAGRLETLEMEIGRISRDLDVLQSQQNGLVNQFEARFAAIEQKSESDKREMIARLTAELERLLKQAAPAPAPAAKSAYGYEHVVRQGETLSTIAKAYNVTTKAIINANTIQNPDRLSVGQKLFIPE